MKQKSLISLGILTVLCLWTMPAPTWSQATGKCPAGWVSRDNSEWCYEFVSNPGGIKTYENAKKACELQHAYLLSVADMAEREWLAERINKIAGANYWWFGLERNSTGAWKWDDGHKGDETPGKLPDKSKLLTWVSGYNDDSPGNCMTISKDSEPSKILYVMPRLCTSSGRYTCKKQKQDVTACDSDNGWVLQNGRCYKAFDPLSSGAYWGDARSTCNKLESDLVSVADKNTNQVVRDLINKNPSTGGTKYWLGLRSVLVSGKYTWRWLDDTPLSYLAWESGLTPNPGVNMCVHAVGTDEAKLWRPYSCNGDEMGFLCSRPTGICATGWYQHRDYCYAIKPTAVSWAQARDDCASYGANLVQIKRDHVQDFLNEYRADFVNQKVDYIWIGLYRTQLDRGELSWTTGGLVSRGFTNWADFEPRLDDSRPNAGRIYAADDKGRWQVADPVAKGGYVCEIPLGKTPLVPTTIYPPFACDEGWLQYGRNCYKLEISIVDWLTAQGNCQKYPGADLIDILDQSEQEFIQSKLDPTKDYWIGLHTRSSNDRRWVWTAGNTLASYFNWAQGQPDNRDLEENCVQMFTSGTWNDVRCTSRLSYICKKSAYPNGSPPTPPATTPDNSDPFCGPMWTRDLTSVNCYMFNLETLSWVDAKQQCEYQGGKLLSIVTIEEKAFIAARIQAIKQANNGVAGFWTGFNDRLEEGTWVWDDNQPVTYLNWASGEPNNAGTGEDCGLIYADSALWNDFPCEKRYPSICKKLGNTLITISPPLTTIQVPDGYQRGCRDGYSGYNNMCYKVYTSQADEVTWDEAKSKCQRDGGDLASVMSLVEHQYLQEMVLPNGAFNYWIGLYNSIALQRAMFFKWNDNSKPTFTYWFKGKPNNYGAKENCVEIVNTEEEWKGRWNDRDCSTKRRFACKQRQIPVKTTQPVTIPYGCPADYNDAYDGYCLKFVNGSEGITAANAKKICQAVPGGTLATIPTQNVQNHIFLRLTQLRILEDYWIGLIRSDRLYFWEDRRIFRYNNWKPLVTWYGLQGYISGLDGMWDLSVGVSITKKNYICQVKQIDAPTTIAPTTTYNPAYCASGWVEADGFCYKGFRATTAAKKLSWTEARAQCRSLNGDLASIHSDAAMKALEDTVGGTVGYWIGLNSRDLNKGFVWSDGSPTEYIKWRDNKQPDNINGNQNCVVLNPNDMSWTLDSCTAAMNRICKVPKGIYPTGSTPEPTTPPDTPDCGGGWKYYNGSCYLFTTKNAAWHDALKDCRGMNADLASIHEVEENNFLLAYTSKMHITLASYWIGLNELGQTSGFRWSDGTGANFFNWNVGEPNNAGGAEHCVAFSSTNGLWKDDQCGEQFRYICKRNNDTSRTQAPVTVMPGKCPRDYFTVGNKCFRVYEDLQLQWSDARELCQTAGGSIRGYLASISSEYEQAALTAYRTRNDSNRFLWIGMFAKYNRHEYYWHDNSPVVYTNWDYNEPNTLDEKCVFMYTEKFRAGKWNDAYCNRKAGFVCMTYKDPSLVTDWQPQTTTVCGPGWMNYGTACFRYESSAGTWDGAQAICSMQNANVASIHDLWEQNYAHFMTESIAQVSTWIGLSDKNGGGRGNYLWSDKWPLTYTNWGKNQPASGTAETCVYMDKTGGWFTGDCNTRLPVLCRKSYGPVPTTLPYVSGVCPDNFMPQGDSCYFVANNTVALTAQEAQYECQKRYRSNLVSILSEGEQNFVAGLIRQKNQNEKKRSDYWIGLLRGSDGGFEWYDNKPLGFVYWSEGEPSNTANENCVELYHINLKWNDHYCTKKNSYVCKMPKLPASTDAITTTITTTAPTTTSRGPQTTVSGQTQAPPGQTSTTREPGQTQRPNGGLRLIGDLRDDTLVAIVVTVFLLLLVAAVLGVFFYRRRVGPKAAGGSNSNTEAFSNANWSSSTNEVSLDTGSSVGGIGLSNPAYKGSGK